MSKTKIVSILSIACAVAVVAFAANAAVDPSITKIKLYKFAVSTDEFCSNPVVVFSSETPVETDLTDNPVLGSGALEDGTYKCVMLEMSDVFLYAPSSTEGACVAGTEYSKGVCDGASLLLDGTPVDCGDGENRVVLYLSTASVISSPEDYVAARCPEEEVDCNGFMPPEPGNLVFGRKLGAPLVVSGDSSGTFVVDLRDGLQESSGSCSIERISFSFR